MVSVLTELVEIIDYLTVIATIFSLLVDIFDYLTLKVTIFAQLVDYFDYLTVKVAIQQEGSHLISAAFFQLIIQAPLASHLALPHSKNEAVHSVFDSDYEWRASACLPRYGRA